MSKSEGRPSSYKIFRLRSSIGCKGHWVDIKDGHSTPSSSPPNACQKGHTPAPSCGSTAPGNVREGASLRWGFKVKGSRRGLLCLASILVKG